MEKYIGICLECENSIKSTHKSHELCPKCLSPILWECPACGGLLIDPKQKYCGRKDCPEKATSFKDMIEKIANKELKPANIYTLQEIKAFLPEDVFKYWENIFENEPSIIDLLANGSNEE